SQRIPVGATAPLRHADAISVKKSHFVTFPIHGTSLLRALHPIRFCFTAIVSPAAYGAAYRHYSKRKAITAQSPKPGCTVDPSVCFRLNRAKANVRQRLCRVSCVGFPAHSLGSVRLRVSTIRRPIRTHGQRRRREL